MSKQISALERLLSLQPLFRGGDLTVRFAWTSKTASQYLYLWKKRKLIAPLGGHSDVYANLLLGRDVDWERAVLMAMPSAVLTGIEVLRRFGWTTQVQRSPSVAVRHGGPHYKLEMFCVEKRGDQWFAAVRQQGLLDAGSQELPSLRPAWALADMIATQGWGKCGLWHDDLDLYDVSSQDEKDWEQACKFFGLNIGGLQEQAQASR